MENQPFILDDETRGILGDVRRLLDELRRRGVGGDTIRAVLAEDGPARLVVGRSGDVRFPGCTGRGLHLTPLERTLYAFVLRNPAGVRAEQMWEHYAELLEDYRRWTVFSDKEQAEAAVDALCDDDRSALQTNVSRIRRKFTDTIGHEAALRFAIVRGKDGAYRIAAPRDAVVLLGA